MERQWLPSDIARWLRRRRKLRRAQEAGEMVSPGDPDFYTDDGGQREFDDSSAFRSLLSVIAVLVAVTVIGYLLFGTLGGGGDDDDTIGSPPATAAPSSTASTAAPPSSEAPASTRPSDVLGDETLSAIIQSLGIGPLDEEAIAELRDLLDDWIDSIRGVLPAYRGRDVDIGRVVAMLARISQASADRTFNNSVYECGDTAPVVVCPADALDVPAGDLAVVAMQLDADIPAASADRSYRYSVVFDTDGDPANDWVFVPPFEFDYFRGSDRWYQAVYDHVAGRWFVEVTQLDETGSITGLPAPSAARFVVDGSWGVWFIPIDELGGIPAGFRVSAFGHDGTFAEDTRGGDVSGIDPTEPLTPFPTTPAATTED